MNGRESPRISVIVPVYRVEPYLARCLDSILGQSHESLEVIAVDDGSPDRSGEILDAYAARDGRLRVIHQENGGLSAARNAGLDLATGEYIGFVDSDDYILPQMYETLLRLIEAYGADIAECAAALDTDTGREDQSGVAVYEGGAAILEATALDRIATPVWCKLYRAGLWQTLRFPEGLLYEDVLTLPAILDAEPRLVRTEQKLYFYNRESTSILRSRKSLRHLRSKEAVFGRMEEYFLAHPALSELHAYYMCSNIPSRNALIRRTDDIPEDLRRAHAKRMYALFCRYWPKARKTEYYRAQPLLKRLLWNLYRLAPGLSNFLAAHYTKKRTR